LHSASHGRFPMKLGNQSFFNRIRRMLLFHKLVASVGVIAITVVLQCYSQPSDGILWRMLIDRPNLHSSCRASCRAEKSALNTLAKYM